MTETLPSGWYWSIGEANRPLTDGGYYFHYASKNLAGSNQHVRRFYEVRFDAHASTMDGGPETHVAEISEMKADDDDTWEVRGSTGRTTSDTVPNGGTVETNRIGTLKMDVIDPDREASQRWTEKQLLEKTRKFLTQLD